MGKLLGGAKDVEPSLSPIYRLEDIPAEDREELQRIAGPTDRMTAVVDSDLLASGQFGRCRLVVCDRQIFVEENLHCTGFSIEKWVYQKMMKWAPALVLRPVI